MPHNGVIFMDCDTGVDDAIALMYLLTDPRTELAGVSTVFGNVDAASAARNTLSVLDVTGRTGQVPVAAGSELTLTGEKPGLGARAHGDNGLGGVVLAEPMGRVQPFPGPQLLVDTVRRRPDEVHLLATGPLTNLAVALKLEPRLPDLVGGITVMGGAAMAPGNVTPAAECNIWRDPEAAQAVLSAPWPLTLVPLDATMREVMSEAQRLEMAASASPVAQFAAAVLDYYFDFYRSVFGERCSACHDALAAAIAVGDVVATRAMTVGVTVDTSLGPSRGATICDLRGLYRGEVAQAGAHCTVVLDTPGDLAARVLQRFMGARA
jgi:inosine-uridine nucleoside N-ribohydrolase